MNLPRFVPFGVEDFESYETLVDGVPAWMAEPLFQWFREQLTTSEAQPYAHRGICLEAQAQTRLNLGVQSGSSALVDYTVPGGRLRAMKAIELLRLADYFVGRNGTHYGDSAKRLERLLHTANSKWRVGERMGRLGLVAREPEAIQASVENVLSTGNQATSLLARAWHKLQALDADPSGAYADAVRSVEIAAVPVVVKNKADATLGDVAGAVANGDWALPLREHRKALHRDVLAGMLRTLYSGHRDRHGHADYSDATADEARAGIVLATVLVDWFGSGGVVRSQDPS